MKSIVKHTLVVLLLLASILGASSYGYGQCSKQPIPPKDELTFSENIAKVLSNARHSEVASQVVGSSLSERCGSSNEETIWGYPPTVEKKAASSSTLYVNQSRTIDISLDVRDIIYPFCYFW